jgi:hypothetical protein
MREHREWQVDETERLMGEARDEIIGGNEMTKFVESRRPGTNS